MTDDSQSPARAGDYLGLICIALATIMLEILLTRIFSVTLWYHLAFVAVSIAMFGMTAGAVIVYLAPRWFTAARAWLNLALSSALFAVTAIASVAIHLRMAIDPAQMTSALFEMSRAYGLIAIPFVFSGIAVSIALTQYPRQIGRLYAADLAGAALGCVLLMAMLEWAGGPQSVLAVGAMGTIAAICFACGSSRGVPSRSRLALAGVSIVLVAATAALAVTRDGSFEIRYAKGTSWPRPVYEKWNSYSRVAVTHDAWEEPFGWGLSTKFKPPVPVRQLHLNIDASAETVMTAYDGVESTIRHLGYDVTNIGHHIRPGKSVYVIGAGGGRDVLSALAFDAKKVTAVELNRAILEALNGRFGDATGHLDRDPRVRFVNDEARSYLARTSEKFDMIQISLIDTWAATAAGAFVLSENTLYTVDAWRTFLNALTDRGMVSVSRWYSGGEPHEVYKTIVLATTALREAGIADTRQHLVGIAKLDRTVDGRHIPGVATLLVSRSPFGADDLATLERVANEMDFRVVLRPDRAETPAFAAVADAAQVDRFVAANALDLSPPTDNRPFFFKMDHRLLRGLLTFVISVALALIVLPVLLKADVKAIAREGSLSLAFVGVGLGFMLVEIAQMMRLTLLLGHPTFSLSVVLFGMLLSSGAGSWSTSRIAPGDRRAIARRMSALLVVLAVLGVITPPIVQVMHTAATPLRVATALALLIPAGFLMGMAFPIAMTLGTAREPHLGPWLWGINGAASVCATVITVAIASTWGIGTAWWTGVACYVVATLLIVRAASSPRPAAA